jgi:hypothetical protein
MKVRISSPGFGMPTLWLPVVLLWPLLFLALFIAFFVGLAAVVCFEPPSTGRFMKLSAGVYRTLCESRGTRIDVCDRHSQVYVTID